MTDLVAVFGSSAVGRDSAAYAEGVRCGRLLAEAGFGVITGGYGGAMEAVSAGAVTAGGRAVGVTAPSVFPGRSGPNAYLTEEQVAPHLVSRIGALLDRSVASIALPGSIGTFTELMMAWNLAFVARFDRSTAKPVVAVGPRWARLVADLAAELHTDGTLITVADGVEDAVEAVLARLQQPG